MQRTKMPISFWFWAAWLVMAQLLADGRLQSCAGDRDAGQGNDLCCAVRWDVDSPGGGLGAGARIVG